MTEKKKYSWEEVEALFITGDHSLKELAELTGKNEKTLYTHSSRGNWKKKREEYRMDIVREKREKARKAAIDDKDQFDMMTDRTCDVIVAQIVTRLSEADAGNKKIKIGELEAMARTTRTTQEIKYRRHDIPAPKQPIELEKKEPFEKYQKELALARAEIERAQDGDGEGDEFVTVKLEPPKVSEN